MTDGNLYPHDFPKLQSQINYSMGALHNCIIEDPISSHWFTHHIFIRYDWYPRVIKFKSVVYKHSFTAIVASVS